MPVKIYEQSVLFTTRQVLPVAIGDGIPPCYPQVQLSANDKIVEQSIALIWMENDFIRLAIAPSLGGRIIALTDLRTGSNVMTLPSEIKLSEHSHRGVVWNHGLEFLSGRDRTLSLGPMEFRVIEASGPEEKGAVFLFEWLGDVSWHGAITLLADRPTFLIEQTHYNRRWLSSQARGGVLFHETDTEQTSSDSCILKSASSEAGIYASWKPGDFILLENSLSTGEPDFALAGHKSDSTRLECTVFSGKSPVSQTSHLATAFIKDATLEIQPHGEISDAKIYLKVNGQTLESPFTGQPGHSSTSNLSAIGANIEGFQLQTKNKDVLLSWPDEKLILNHPVIPASPNLDEIIQSAVQPMRAYRRVSGLEAFSYWAEALNALKEQQWADADELLEQYLGFNAEDSLAWWLKSSVRRESGKAKEEDSPELPNAHYLAPLEPLLRAEAFLNTPQAASREPNPLLASVAANPDHAAGCVGMYLECHLYLGMARLADELLRHRDNAMVRYLLAYALLSQAKNETAAAEHITLAGKQPIEPPFPYRLVEKRAVLELSRRFPNNERLNTLSSVLARLEQNPNSA